MTTVILRATDEHLPQWIAMRAALWPDASSSEHQVDAAASIANDRPDLIAFIAFENGRPIGFAEASVRQHRVNGCDTVPAAFLEAMYVDPQTRHHGVARTLCSAVENWARDCGCIELGSDAELENNHGQAFHEAVGFKETERVVFYRKLIQSPL